MNLRLTPAFTGASTFRQRRFEMLESFRGSFCVRIDLCENRKDLHSPQAGANLAERFKGLLRLGYAAAPTSQRHRECPQVRKRMLFAKRDRLQRPSPSFSFVAEISINACGMEKRER